MGLGSCEAATEPEILENAGRVSAGTPEVEMELIHSFAAPTVDWMPPSVVALGLGRSAPTRDRNVGCAAAPVVGPAQTRLAAWVAKAAVSVPETVTGLPETVMIEGSESPTEVTEPEPVLPQEGLAAAPPDTRICPFVPGGRASHPEADRYRISPWVEPITSRIELGAVGVGAAVDPAVFASTVPVETGASESVPLRVIGPPVNPAPLATLCTVPAPGTVCHVAA